MKWHWFTAYIFIRLTSNLKSNVCTQGYALGLGVWKKLLYSHEIYIVKRRNEQKYNTT